MILPPIFSDGMIIQRQKPFRIRGEHAGDGSIRVSMCGISAETRAVDGRWGLVLPPMEACERTELVIQADGHTTTIRDVAVGEVWIAGGQSNMRMELRYSHTADELAGFSRETMIRYYEVPRITYAGQERDEPEVVRGAAVWHAPSSRHLSEMSSVAFHFAKKLRDSLKIPVGILSCNYGGSPAFSWIDEETLRADPSLRPFWEEYTTTLSALDLEKYRSDYKAYREIMAHPAVAGLIDQFRAGRFGPDDLGLALSPLSDEEKREYLAQRGMGPYEIQSPGVLYRTMLSTIAGYPVRGALWYQGEQDARRWQSYQDLFRGVVQSWRTAWGEDFPFLFVQLPGFERDMRFSAASWPELRAQQEQSSRSVGNVYMISTMDVGDRHNLHPLNKRPVGERLADTAQYHIYGMDIPKPCYPIGVSARYANHVVTIQFDDAEAGLDLRGSRVEGLELFCGEALVTQKSARAENNILTIISSGPVDRIRFAWQGYCDINLFSAAGLPARPFVLRLSEEPV